MENRGGGVGTDRGENGVALADVAAICLTRGSVVGREKTASSRTISRIFSATPDGPVMKPRSRSFQPSCDQGRRPGDDFHACFDGARFAKGAAPMWNALLMDKSLSGHKDRIRRTWKHGPGDDSYLHGRVRVSWCGTAATPGRTAVAIGMQRAAALPELARDR
jgi:hypothetical protein